MRFSKPILQTAQNKRTLVQISLMTLLVQILKVCQMTHWKPLIMELSLMLPRRQRSRTDNPDQDHLNSDTGVPVATHRMSLQVIREQVDTCRM